VSKGALHFTSGVRSIVADGQSGDSLSYQDARVTLSYLPKMAKVKSKGPHEKRCLFPGGRVLPFLCAGKV
jgi:hypothetical protein